MFDNFVEICKNLLKDTFKKIYTRIFSGIVLKYKYNNSNFGEDAKFS